MGDDERRFRDRSLPMRRAVHESFVGEVHEIVEHEAVVAIDVELASASPAQAGS